MKCERAESVLMRDFQTSITCGSLGSGSGCSRRCRQRRIAKELKRI